METTATQSNNETQTTAETVVLDVIRETKNTNPNGANSTQSDPREQLCWDNYIKSITENRENAYKAAIDAGYSESSAKNITMRDWFKERLGKLKRKDMLSDAEKLLHKTLKYEHIDENGKVNVQLLSVQTKVADTIVKTLGKDDGYSTRSEITGKDGEDISTTNIIYLPTKDYGKE